MTMLLVLLLMLTTLTLHISAHTDRDKPIFNYIVYIVKAKVYIMKAKVYNMIAKLKLVNVTITKAKVVIMVINLMKTKHRFYFYDCEFRSVAFDLLHIAPLYKDCDIKVTTPNNVTQTASVETSSYNC